MLEDVKDGFEQSINAGFFVDSAFDWNFFFGGPHPGTALRISALRILSKTAWHSAMVC